MQCFNQSCNPFSSQNRVESDLYEEMEDYKALLKAHIIKAKDLVNKDIIRSDPYVTIEFGDFQKVKTFTVKRNLNPTWDDELTLGVPNDKLPLLKVEVMDKDSFSSDESLGTAIVDISPLVKMAEIYKDKTIENREKTILTLPASQNEGFACDSYIFIDKGQIKQKLCLKLKNVTSGELEMELRWIYL